MGKIVFHIDVNSAFLSWSAILRLQQGIDTTDLRTIPSAVGGDEEARHGVVLAKSMPAKKYGVTTGEPLAAARRKCPGLIVIRPDFGFYVEQSNRLRQLLAKYTDRIVPFSIDEAWAEFEGFEELQRNPEVFANRLREEIKETLGFTVNIGVSTNRLLSKMAGDFKKPDLVHGLIAMRKMHMRVIEESGLTSADEMLYPDNWSYLSDILSYVAVGARSVENQQHRLTISGLDIPAGMKNPTSGDFSVMLNSVIAAQGSHTFIYRNWEVKTTGNPLTHTILRGAVNKHGNAIPNYHYEDVQLLLEKYRETNLKNPAVIIDANHSNSNKQYEQQIRIVREVMHNRQYSEDIRKLVKGVMIESYLEPGSQKIGCGTHVYGKSITDPCLGWEDTEKLIYKIADLC